MRLRRVMFVPRCLALVALALLLACRDVSEDVPLEPGSLVWIGPDSVPLSVADEIELLDVGFNGAVVEVAQIEWLGERATVQLQPPAALPVGLPMLLATTGEWRGAERGVDEITRRLSEPLGRMLSEARTDGALPIGFHFDLEVSGDLASYAAFLESFSIVLNDSLSLSVTLPVGWQAEENREALERMTEAVDFVVAFGYGQRQGEPETDAAWNLDKIAPLLESLEALGEPYRFGLISQGRAEWRGDAGELLGTTAKTSLGQLVRDSALEIDDAFDLRGPFRQNLEFTVERPSRLADWDLSPQQKIRVVRVLTSHLEAVVEEARMHSSELRLGQVHYRLPPASDRLSLSHANWVGVYTPGRAAPVISADLNLVKRGRRSWKVSVVLANDSAETTDLARIDGNYVEIAALGGVFGKVDRGELSRYGLFKKKAGLEVRTFRDANLLRFYVPVLEPGQRLESGEIEIELEDSKKPLILGGSFLVPDGSTLELATLEWHPDRETE